MKFPTSSSIWAISGASIIGCLTGISIERNSRASAAQEIIFEKPATFLTPGGDAHKHPVQYDKGQRVMQIMRHGWPTSDTIRTYDNFVLSYDRRNKTAHWVFEHLTPELVHAKNVDRTKSEFFEDNTIHPYFRASLRDYFGSGFDRGHLAPAGNHRLSQQTMSQTFVLSNISPQVGKGFNRDTWNTLEQYVRYRAARARNLWVCTGPLYLARNESDGKNYVKYQVIGPNEVAVPTHFFKALLVENKDGSLDVESYVMQNTPLDSQIPLRSFQVPLDSIERHAGFLIFEGLNPSLISTYNGNNRFVEEFQKKMWSEKIKQEEGLRQRQIA
jgi:endonuclease G